MFEQFAEVVTRLRIMNKREEEIANLFGMTVSGLRNRMSIGRGHERRETIRIYKILRDSGMPRDEIAKALDISELSIVNIEKNMDRLIYELE